MLSEPALALTDLVLGLVALGLTVRVASIDGIHRSWVLTFAWTAAAALAGFVHHGFVTFSPALVEVGFAVVSGMVVVAVSYLLSATVFEVLGPGRRRAFWVLRVASLGAYLALAAGGRAGAESILMAEGLTMALIVGLWLVALRRSHPLAPRVFVGFLVSGLAAVVHAIPEHRRIVGLDPISLYHLAQIPGLVLIALAVSTPTGPARAHRVGVVTTAT